MKNIISQKMRGKGSLFRLVISFLLYVFDVGFDISVAITYYQQDDLWWFGITLAFIIVPSILVNIFSLINMQDTPFSLKNLLICVLQLSVIQQYWKGFKQLKKENWYNQPCNENYNHDWRTCPCESCKFYIEEKKTSAECTKYLALTRYVETFTESAPQWCLQNYIMLRQWSFPWITITSTVFNLLSLAWSITSLKEMNIKTENDITITFPKRALIWFLVSQLGILLSRLSAIVIFTYVFRQYVFIIIGIHWAAVFVVIIFREVVIILTEGANVDALVVIRSFIISFSFLFYFSKFLLRIISDKTYLTILFHFIYFFENCFMVLLSVTYYPTNTPHIFLIAIIALFFVFVGYAIGVSFQLCYNATLIEFRSRNEQISDPTNNEMSSVLVQGDTAL